jgi:hypothetical protein
MMFAPSAHLLRAALPLLMLAVTSCSGDVSTTSPVPIDLAAARRRWVQFAPAAYQITVGRSCFCGPDVTRAVVVMVRNGQVESRRYEDTGADVPAQIAPAYPTVDGLFDVIAEAIGQHAATVDVLYDASRGFPVSIEIDGSLMIADDEMFYGTRNFVVR